MKDHQLKPFFIKKEGKENTNRQFVYNIGKVLYEIKNIKNLQQLIINISTIHNDNSKNNKHEFLSLLLETLIDNKIIIIDNIGNMNQYNYDDNLKYNNTFNAIRLFFDNENKCYTFSLVKERDELLEEFQEGKYPYVSCYNYNNITVNGNFEKKLFRGHLDIDDPNLKIKNLDGTVFTILSRKVTSSKVLGVDSSISLLVNRVAKDSAKDL